MVFFIFFLSFLGFSNLLPPSFLLNNYSKLKKNGTTLKIKMELEYKNLKFNETLLYSSPDSYRTLVKKEKDAILFIRKKDKCLAISKSKNIDTTCSDYKHNFFYNIIFYNVKYFQYLKYLGVDFDESIAEIVIDKETGKGIKPDNVYLTIIKNKPIYIVGLSSDEIESVKSNIKIKEDQSFSEILLSKLKDFKSQVWIDKKSMLPIRIFSLLKDSNKDKKFEIVLKYFTSNSNNFHYPKSLDYFVDDEKILSYNIKDIETELKIKGSLFDVDNYAKRFNQNINEDDFNENKKLLLEYIRKYR